MQNDFLVCALYKFTPLPAYQILRAPLLELMQQLEVRGSLLLASEGINGTVAGKDSGIKQLLAWLEQQPGLQGIEPKFSRTPNQPFNRSKVKLKREIVTMGVEGIDPLRSVGTYLDAEQWNELLAGEDVLLIDTRNDYEVALGKFKGAIDPQTGCFSEFPQYIKDHYDPEQTPKVAMYCTGGIRCEKSTALLKQYGFKEVYHLQGGILKYLESMPQEQSLWEGECYVFDERVSVDHQLQPGKFELCHSCRFPVSLEDRQHPHYSRGVSCPRCYSLRSEEQREQLRQRQLQVELAQARGEAHLGEDAKKIAAERKQQKLQRKEANRLQQQQKSQAGH